MCYANHCRRMREKKGVGIYLFVATWYVLEKSWIQSTICDAVRP